MTSLSPRAAALRRFWFAGDQATRFRGAWFRKDPAFDAELRHLFTDDMALARAGRLDDWQASRAGCVALLLLLDQVPRNLHRGFPDAFAADAQARAVAESVIARGFDGVLPVIERVFVYLPFEHSEALADQQRSVALFAALPVTPPELDAHAHGQVMVAARRHLEIIERFGRFPHRNRALGRVTTTAEEAFLREPFSAF